MYTKDGAEVRVIRKIEEGYLAQYVYQRDEEHEGYYTELSDQVILFSELFEKAPTQKYADEVTALQIKANGLKETITSLKEEIRGIKYVKAQEENTIKTISKYPIFKQLADYLTGEFKYVLWLKNLDVRKKESHYNTHEVRVSKKDEGVFAIYELRHKEYWSDSDDRPFLVFQSEEEANQYAKEVLIKRIKNYSSTYNRVSNLKSLWSSFSFQSPLLKDADVLEVYQNKLKQFQNLEDKERADKLREELKQADQKRKELESLTQKVAP